MLHEQMLMWQLESVLDVPRDLPLKVGQKRVSNRGVIADIEFVWWVVCKVIFASYTYYYKYCFWQMFLFDDLMNKFDLKNEVQLKNENNSRNENDPKLKIKDYQI